MNVRTAALLALAVFLAAALAPAAGSDGLSETEVRISIPEIGYDSIDPSSVPKVSMPSNSSKTLHAYVYNDSLEYVIASFVFHSVDNEVTVRTAESSNYVEPGKISETEVTIKTLEYAKSGSFNPSMVVTVTSMGGTGAQVYTINFEVNVSSSYDSGDYYNKFFGIFPNEFENELGDPWFASLVTMVVLLVANFALCYVIVPLLTYKVRSGVSKSEKRQLRKSVTRIMSIMMFMYSLTLCARIIGAGPTICHFIGAASNLVYVCVGALLVWRIYIFIIHALFKGVDDINIEGVDSSLIPLFKMFGQIVISITAVAAILASFGVDLAGILMSAGVVTLGITMGAQNILGQFFSGIVLLATRPFRRGDFIKVNGSVYIVKKVKIMFTELYTWEVDQTVTMPNNALTAATIVNVTKETKEVRIYVYMSIAYEADIALAKKLMLQAANEHPHVVINERRSPPSTRLTNFLDSGIEIRLAAYVDDFDNSGTYAGELRERMFELFLENGVEIPYTKYEVTLKQPCDGKKRPDDNLD